MEAMAGLYDVFSELDLEDWSCSELVKNDLLWLRLKHGNLTLTQTNQKQPTHSSQTSSSIRKNLKVISLRSLPDAALPSFSPVSVQVDVNAYFNFQNKTYGLTLPLRNLTVNPSSKRIPL
jgi:hypothetical protein